MAGSSPISKLKPGNFIEIDGEPCKVLRITLSKPGKHGSTKARIDAVGIFDNRKRMSPMNSVPTKAIL